MNEKNTVTLDLAKFSWLNERSVKYGLLIDLILRLAEDGVEVGEIEVNGDDVLEIVKAFEPGYYEIFMKERRHK